MYLLGRRVTVLPRERRERQACQSTRLAVCRAYGGHLAHTEVNNEVLR